MIRSDHGLSLMSVIWRMDNPRCLLGLIRMRFLTFLFAFVLWTWSFSSHAWWNEDWTSRKKITLAGPTGELADAPVLIRLHTGNFDFFSANDNGGDVRLLAGDDKTELKFHFEKGDVVNELALLWVKGAQALPSD